MRDGILCWYPFKPGASVLDLSSGVLRELLRQRCEKVETKETSAGNLFDYIVLLDPTDFSSFILKELNGRLKPNGRLLLAYENPFAMPYWSGKRSPVTGNSYDSLYGLDGRPGAAELRLRLTSAGFGGQKWYYPVNDQLFAEEIYSEAYLPNEFFNQRFHPYLSGGEDLQFNYLPLYREVIRGGAFEFLCGAYLVEARMCADDLPCPVDYAAVTAYREPAKRFATAVRNDDTVHKIPLHSAARKSVQNILLNHEALAGFGVKVVPLQVENDILTMPRLKLPSLSDYLAQKLVNNAFDYDKILRLFNRIRDNIFKAAATGDCYWELVPANCFYNEKRDELIFFDQEFRWRNRSPDIAAARAILPLSVSPPFNCDIRAAELFEQLKERFGLAKNWDTLRAQAEEATKSVFGGKLAELAAASEAAVDRRILQQRTDRFGHVPEQLRKTGFSNPILYGYGRRGTELETALNRAGMKPVAIVDRQHGVYPSVSLIPPEISADVIVVSISGGEAIAEELKQETGLPVFTLEELQNECLATGRA